MSIRFKFRSSVNYDTVDIDGRSSISVAELRAKIIRYKKLNVCHDFDLVFSDAASGQEFDDHKIQIPSGSSVIIKRVPAGRAPSALDAVVNFGANDSHAFNPVSNQEDAYRFDALKADLRSDPEDIVPGFAPEFDKNRCGSSGKENVAGPRCEGPRLGSNGANPDVIRGCNLSRHKEKIEEKMKVEKLAAPDSAPAEIIGLPSELKCSLCNTYFKEAVMIPCCQHSFCNECIRLVLIQRGRCPKCSSGTCRVDDLLPNLSLRRAIEHFLASHMSKDSSEKDLCKYAPDGESRIQGEDDFCAANIVQRGPEPPHSPSVAGRGSNIVMPEPFHSSVIRRNASFGAPVYAVTNLTSGRNMSTPTIHEVKDIHGERGLYARNADGQHGPKDVDPTADCQGENNPLNLPQANALDEAYSTGKRKRGFWETEGGERNFAAAGWPNKVNRNCYMCGSPNHLIRYCPASSGPHSMLQTGRCMLQGGFPGYASFYLNAAVYPPARPFPNIYTSPGMMSFNASTIPVMRCGAPPHVPSAYGALPSPGGIMRMGTMAPPVVNKAAHLLSHLENLMPLHCEKTRKLPNENLHRGQNCLEEDDINKHYRCQEPEKPREYKTRKDREASESHSGDSFAQRSYKHQHREHSDSDAYSVDAKTEKKSHSSGAGKNQKPYIERADSGMPNMPNNGKKSNEVRHKHHDRSSRRHHERTERSHSNSSHGRHHQSERDDVRCRVESDVGSSRRKRSRHSDSGLKPSSSADKRKPHQGRDSGYESRHRRQTTKHNGEDLCDDRWQMIDGLDEERRGEYGHHKRKRIH